MTQYETLCGRPCRLPLCWTEVGENSITGPDLIRDISESELDTIAYSHGTEPTEELCRCTTSTLSSRLGITSS